MGPNLQQANSRHTQAALILIAWLATLSASVFSDAVWRELTGGLQHALLWKVALLIPLVVLSWCWKRIRPLQPYFILISVLILAWSAMGWVRTTPVWSTWEGRTSWTLGMAGIQLLKLAIALIMIGVLFMKRRRQDFFLVKGRTDAMAEPVRWLGMKEPMPWAHFGLIIAACSFLGAFLFLALTTLPSLKAWIGVLPVLPAIGLISTTNAFSEEIIFRSSLLSALHKVLGKQQALLLTAVFFGFAHYAGGFPSGMFWFLITGFMGWLFGKSMLETKGFFWAWFLHFVSDIPVLAFTAMASIGAVK